MKACTLRKIPRSKDVFISNAYDFLDECFVEKVGVPICGKGDEK